MEKLLHAQIIHYLTSNSLLYKHQAGFLPTHSTVTQLCYLIHNWQMALDKGDHTQAVFLDLSKAYDRVSIPGLLFKLSALGFSSDALQWLSSFLTDRQQCVRVNGCLSSSQCPRSGIPQGTVLGPVLFLVFINDLPCSISSECSIFADDTTVHSTGSDARSTCLSLSNDLHSASEWASIWGMLFNAQKSVHLSVSSGTNKEIAGLQSYVTMDNIPLLQVASHKHLGVHVHKTLSWQCHIDHLYTACAQKVGMLKRLRRRIGKNALRKIYEGAVRPRLEYACAVWSGGPIAKLVKLQENFCRRHDLQMPSLQQRFAYHTLVLFYKLHSHRAPLYLTSLLPSLSSNSGYPFRKLSYPVPLVKKTSTLSSFIPRSIILWNDLPSFVQQSRSISIFKTRLRSHLKL